MNKSNLLGIANSHMCTFDTLRWHECVATRSRKVYEVAFRSHDSCEKSCTCRLQIAVPVYASPRSILLRPSSVLSIAVARAYRLLLLDVLVYANHILCAYVRRRGLSVLPCFCSPLLSSFISKMSDSKAKMLSM